MVSIRSIFKDESVPRPDWKQKYEKTTHPGWIKRKSKKRGEAKAVLGNQIIPGIETA